MSIRYHRRTLLFVIGAVLLLFGLACLNYTRVDGIEHHRQFARQHGLPEPSAPILFGGVASIVFGAGAIGYALGSRQRPT